MNDTYTMSDYLLLVCRTCHAALRYRRPDGIRTVWFCERCTWSAPTGSERLDHMAYGRSVNPAYGERNRYYPDQWGR